MPSQDQDIPLDAVIDALTAQNIAYHPAVQIAIDTVIEAIGTATESLGIHPRTHSRIVWMIQEDITQAIQNKAESVLRSDRHD